MSSLSISSSAIHSSTFSNHIYLSVDIISVYLRGAMHQWPVLSQLLFSVVMDGIPSEARSGSIPSDLLYADDLVVIIIIIIMYFYSASIQLPAQERFYE